jgi:hypothetical protein
MAPGPAKSLARLRDGHRARAAAEPGSVLVSVTVCTGDYRDRPTVQQRQVTDLPLLKLPVGPAAGPVSDSVRPIPSRPDQVPVPTACQSRPGTQSRCQ